MITLKIFTAITEFSTGGIQSQILLLLLWDYLKSMSLSLFCARDLLTPT